MSRFIRYAIIAGFVWLVLVAVGYAFHWQWMMRVESWRHSGVELNLVEKMIFAVDLCLSQYGLVAAICLLPLLFFVAVLLAVRQGN